MTCVISNTTSGGWYNGIGPEYSKIVGQEKKNVGGDAQHGLCCGPKKKDKEKKKSANF